MSMSPELRAALDAIGPEPQMPQWLDQQELQTYTLQWSARIEAQRDALLVWVREHINSRDGCCVHRADSDCGLSAVLAKCGDAP